MPVVGARGGKFVSCHGELICYWPMHMQKGGDGGSRFPVVLWGLVTERACILSCATRRARAGFRDFFSTDLDEAAYLPFLRFDAHIIDLAWACLARYAHVSMFQLLSEPTVGSASVADSCPKPAYPSPMLGFRDMAAFLARLSTSSAFPLAAAPAISLSRDADQPLQSVRCLLSYGRTCLPKSSRIDVRTSHCWGYRYSFDGCSLRTSLFFEDLIFVLELKHLDPLFMHDVRLHLTCACRGYASPAGSKHVRGGDSVR